VYKGQLLHIAYVGENPTSLGIFQCIFAREYSTAAALETPNDKKFRVLFEFVVS